MARYDPWKIYLRVSTDPLLFILLKTIDSTMNYIFLYLYPRLSQAWNIPSMGWSDFKWHECRLAVSQRFRYTKWEDSQRFNRDKGLNVPEPALSFSASMLQNSSSSCYYDPLTTSLLHLETKLGFPFYIHFHWSGSQQFQSVEHTSLFWTSSALAVCNFILLHHLLPSSSTNILHKFWPERF